MNRFLDALDRSLTFKQLLWLVPFVLALHNAEEALTMPRWVMGNLPLIKSRLPAWIEIQFTPTQLLLSLVLATVVPFIVTLVCIDGERKSKKLFLLMLLQMIIFINVFIPHITASIQMRQYNPGVVTAVCFNLPFSLYFFRRAYREEYIAPRGFASLILVAVVLYPAVAWTLHFGGEWIAKSL